MAAAAADADADAAPPALVRPDLAAAKALMFLCLASLWVALAAPGGAAIVALAARDYSDDSPVADMLMAVSSRAVVFAVLLGLTARLLVLRAALCDAGFREELRRASGASTRSMLGDTTVRACLTALLFTLLIAFGCLVLVVLSPKKGSRTGRIGAMMVVVGAVGVSAISCFVILPSLALKLWRMKLGSAAAGSIV